jgi:DNA-binding beta-propeller fold protein YncE
VTRFEVEPNRREKGGTPAVIVLSDSDLNLRDDRPHRDILSFRDADGRVLHTLEEFHVSQSVGAAHVVAIDRQRNRVYVCENVAHCVTALDLHGRKLWRVDQIDADTLAVDPKTGNLWCSGGPNLSSGATVVLDAQGNEVASYPDHGIDIAYDPKTDGFWLVGYGIKKLSREGKVLFERPHEGWACVSVAVYPNDGSVWIGERNHPDVAHSRNRLWHLDASGNVLLSEPLDELNPYAVACDPKSGTVYVANLRSSILRFSADGRPQPPASIPVTAVSVSPSSGQLWATTATELLRLDHAGAVQSRTPLGADSLASWPTGF